MVQQEQLTALEDILVKEFRLCQNLYALNKEERTALSGRDAAALTTLVENKESMLDEFGQLEDSRRMIMQQVVDAMGMDQDAATLADVIRAIEGETARRLDHLHQGVIALTKEIKDLTQGNRALAETALEHVDAVQAYLLSLLDVSAVGYRPPRVPVSQSPSVTFEIDQGV